jgi:adenylate cyclase
VALVVTDVQNSVKLWEGFPREMNQALRMHDQLLRAEIARVGGYEVTTEGDSFQVSAGWLSRALWGGVGRACCL